MISLPYEEKNSKYQDTCNKAWNGLLQGAESVVSIYGTFKLGDLFSITNFDPNAFGHICLVLINSKNKSIVPGYEESMSNMNIFINKENIVFSLDSEKKDNLSHSNNLLQKAQWN